MADSNQNGAKDRFVFYADEIGGHWWFRQSPEGIKVGGACQSFRTRADCEENAKRNGWKGGYPIEPLIAKHVPTQIGGGHPARVVKSEPNDWVVVLDPMGKRPLLTGTGKDEENAVYILGVEYGHWVNTLVRKAEGR